MQVERHIEKQHAGFCLRLTILAFFFLIGIVMGQVWSAHIPDGIDLELKRYLQDFLSLESDETAGETILSAFLLYYRYPVVAFLLGFVSAGVLFVPVLTLLYGFFLSFSVCCFAAAFGRTGIVLALAVFGFRCLWTLPCYFALAVPAFHRSLMLVRRHIATRGKRVQALEYEPVGWLRFVVVLFCLFAGVLLELILGPRILDAVLTHLFT